MSYTPTTDEITMLRRMTGEYPAGTSTYSDAELSTVLVNRNGDLHASASDIWNWKAAAVAALFDFSADGGDYKQSVLYDRYKANAMAEAALSPLTSGMIIDPTLENVEG